MRIYKELWFVGDRSSLDEFIRTAPSFAYGDWKYVYPERMKDFIIFAYVGNKVEQSEVSIYCGEESLEQGQLKVGNIVPLNKKQLTIDEYNAVLDLFYEEIIAPNQLQLKNQGLTINGPESDAFDPLKYISGEALKKLERFCSAANKTTGSSHPNDEERWFDFICQTVDDDRFFDYDTIFRFLMDEEYWGKKEPSSISAIGHFAWDEEHAAELASEYDNYVRILQFYKSTRGKRS